MAVNVQKNKWYFPSISIGKNTEIHRRRVALTFAQIRALHSVPQNLTPSRGTGKIVLYRSSVIEFFGTTTQYTGGGTVIPVYTGTTASLSGDALPAATVQSASTSYTYLGQDITGTGLVLLANKGIDLYANTADFAVGTGTMVINLEFEVITIG